MRNMGQAPLRVYPGRFIGLSGTVYNAAFIDALKQSLLMKIWDAQSRTWWFPESYLAIVEQLCIQHNVLDQHWFTQFYDKSFPTGPRNPYEVLHLAPDAPMHVVTAAYTAMKNECTRTGGVGSQLHEVEEAFRLIKG